jgi:hypothetical protein
VLTRIFSLWQLHTTLQFQLYLRLHNVITNQLRRQVQVSEYFMVLVMTVVYQFRCKLILALHPHTKYIAKCRQSKYQFLSTETYFCLVFSFANGNSFTPLFLSILFIYILLYLDEIHSNCRLIAKHHFLCVILAYTVAELYYAIHSFADTKAGRYNPRMDPIIPVENWRKGSQVLFPRLL